MKTSLFLLLLLLGAAFISVSGAAKPPPAKGKDVKKKGFDNSKEAVELLVLSKKVRNVLVSGNLRRASKVVAPNARSLLSKKNDSFGVGGNFVGPKGHIRLYRILTKKLLTAFGKRRLRNKRIIIVPARRKVTYFRRYPGGVKGVRPGRYSITHFFNKNYKLQRIVTKKHRSLKPGKPGKKRPPPSRRAPSKRVACIKRCRSKPTKLVCGKFNRRKRTFRNSCTAKCFGVNKALPGRCRKIGGVGTPPPRRPSPPKKPSRGTCIKRCRKKPKRLVCGKTIKRKKWRTFRNLCDARCFGVKVTKPGRCPLSKRAQCLKGARSKPTKPVCGKFRGKKRTFRNAFVAKCLGVKTRAGKCPPSKLGKCLRVCAKKPVKNVCGSRKGKTARTFRNRCQARCLGVMKARPGECPPPRAPKGKSPP